MGKRSRGLDGGAGNPAVVRSNANRATHDAGRWRFLWLHVWGAWALAIAPVLDVLRQHPEFLIANDFDSWRIAGLLCALLVILPAPWVAWAWFRRHSGGRLPVLLLAPPLLLIGLIVAGRFSAGWGGSAAASAGAALFVWLYSTRPGIRQYASLLVSIGFVAPALLLIDPSVRRLAARSGGVDLGAADDLAPPIVVVVLDELPITTLLNDDGALDRRRFPHLSELAERSHWFENTSSVDPATAQAVSALLAGRRTQPGELPIWRDLPDNLFTLLARRYRISAVEPVTRLCPVELNRFTAGQRPTGRFSSFTDVAVIALHVWSPSRLAELLPPIHTGWGGFTRRDGSTARNRRRSRWWRHFVDPPALGGDRVQQFRALVAEIDDHAGGNLYFFHLLMPHRPWIYMPDGLVYRVDGRHEVRTSMNPRWPEYPSIAAQAYQRHLLQAEFTDRLIGELLDRLDAHALFDASLVVVAADHGISFRPGDMMRELTAINHEDLLQVPLLVKLPGQKRPVHHAEPRSTLDVLPTILEIVGIEKPPSLEGRSLFAPAAATARSERVWEGLAYRRSLFGELEESADLFEYGPFAEWIGKRLGSLPLEARPELRIELPRGELLSRPDDQALLPGWIYGYVEGLDAVDGLGIAVVVDGVVAATGECYPVEGRLRFNVLIPAEALPVGEHRLDVVVIDPVSGIGWQPAPN